MTQHARRHARRDRISAAGLSAILVLLLALEAPIVAQRAQPALPAATVARIEKAVTAFMDSSYKIPGGGWLSTAGDMVRFGLALQDGALLKPASVTRMTTMEKVTGKADTFYGLGWIVDGWGVPGKPRMPGLAWHGGVQQGVTTNLYMLLPDRTVVAVLTNLEGEGLALTELASEITSVLPGR